ncbi:MAG TPA: SpoIID/LytB domain-containing protein, partial [Mobilitalea sp.]|nr:SpoIID/LytB domain-containing protein [Mobilitalea sp.]
MKSLLVKVILVSILVLLLPFILTLLLSDKSDNTTSLAAMDFHVFYDKGGKSEELEFDQYLIGVVAANMPAGYSMEAL